MAYQALAAAAPAAPAAPSQVVQMAIASLPPCYSQDLDNCILRKPNAIKNCDLINQAYEEGPTSYQQMQAAVDAMSFCAEPNKTLLIGLGLGGLALGFTLAVLLR